MENTVFVFCPSPAGERGIPKFSAVDHPDAPEVPHVPDNNVNSNGV
eukprot:CAMPEP_0116840024 /NCGR_PEP_ID=MMETSP0418-20121206/10102_1 /TAXON_ID=1158023 /ORGANISM="Astrosyne radiata, Strain 13vi08-1A" /LENGTH=45 /DNA_ID= /DNA_START= /DNA_END= /DNA_ORIENTATION=